MSSLPFSLTYLWLLVPAVIIIWGVSTYNRFVSRRRTVDEGWSGISVQLKRRHDLIPNLVETVKGYAGHEQSTLAEVVKMRGAAVAGMAGGPSPALAEAERGLSGALGRLLAVAESYPDLKANVNFTALQGSLQEVEDQLQMARRYYNGTVRDYMILKESFPSLIIGKVFNFAPAAFFELDNETEKAVPQVKF